MDFEISKSANQIFLSLLEKILPEETSNFRIDKSKHNEYLPSEIPCFGDSGKSANWMVCTHFQWRNTVFQMGR